MAHRYKVKYGDKGGYVVRDTLIKSHPILFYSESKSAAIMRAQELNGFTPVDGSEQTYYAQVTKTAANRGR